MSQTDDAEQENSKLTRAELRDLLSEHLMKRQGWPSSSESRLKIVKSATRRFFEEVNDPKQRSFALDRAYEISESLCEQRRPR